VIGISVAHGDARSLSDDQPRILVVPETVTQAVSKVAPFLAFGSEPRERPIREHPVQEHQALDRPVDSDSPAVPVVRLAERGVERLMVNVEDSRPSGRSEPDGGHEPPDQELLDEVVDLLPMRDAGERGVLSADEHAGVQHDSNQEGSLAIRQIEWCGDASALDSETICARRV
jgi:hypothetical protein